MWYTLLIVVHVLSCVFLISVVLLQQGKGADVGAVFGGSSQTLFGTSGAGNLLTKLTSATAVIFMLTSLSLTYGVARRSTSSIFDDAPVSAPTPAPSGDEPLTQPSPGTEAQGTTSTPAGESAQTVPPATVPGAESSLTVTTTPAPAQTVPSAPPAQTAPAATAPTPTEQPPAPVPTEPASK